MSLLLPEFLAQHIVDPNDNDEVIITQSLFH